MNIVQYIQGRAVEVPLPRWQKDAVIELSLPDGRTVQVVFESTGDVYLRGWGNVPAKLGNCNRMMFVGRIECEEPTTCEVCYGKLGYCGCNGCAGGEGCADFAGDTAGRTGLPTPLPGE